MIAQQIIDGMDSNAIERALIAEQVAFAAETRHLLGAAVVAGLVFGTNSQEYKTARARHLEALVGWCDAHVAVHTDETVSKLRAAYAGEIARLGAR